MSGLARALRICLFLALGGAVSACALPRSGPDYAEITAEPAADLPFDVVPVTAAVVSLSRADESLGFGEGFLTAAAENTSLIEAGDVLSITVWENAQDGLLNAEGTGATVLPDMRVDEQGMIHVPYVGPVRARGRTMADLRNAIRAQLAERTLDPQVDVFPHVSDARAVSVQGVVSAPGLYPIRPATRRVLPMLAQSGGVSADPEVVRIRLRRGNATGEVWLQDLYDKPEMNVALRSGDAVIAERDRRIFTALGAVGRSATVPFPVRDLSVARALGQVSGLIDEVADPTGVFLFRTEPPAVAAKLFPGQPPAPRRVAYVLDLTQPGGMFLAAEFIMRDQDMLYVTSAPFTQWRKVVSSIAPVLGLAGATRALGGF